MPMAVFIPMSDRYRITGNGLKTTDCLNGAYDRSQAIRPRIGDFEAFVEEHTKRGPKLSQDLVLGEKSNGR